LEIRCVHTESTARHASYERLARLVRDIIQSEYTDFKPPA
jgi:hypothetical protein